MSRWHSYLNSARDILLAYHGEEPFASFVKKQFAKHKKFGSTDRRQISHLCYCYFRLGKSSLQLPIEERILAALFLCSTSPDSILEAIRPDWNSRVSLPIKEKLELIEIGDIEMNLFPEINELSDEILKDEFVLSHFVQPDLFLRLRPGHGDVVMDKLTSAGISFTFIKPGCLALPNASKIENVIQLDREAVVQDLNSQRVGEYVGLALEDIRNENEINPQIKVWDCCAGSGGKSIMAYDADPKIHLTVSDRRESILINLKKRFREAGIRNFDSYVPDVSKPIATVTMHSKTFDFIIADVPCTGSGTWGRTPEQLVNFKESEIVEYAALQKKIVGNVIHQVKPGGYFLYITCSVYKKENEEIVQYLLMDSGIELVKSEILKGYMLKADTMFVALFRYRRK